MKVFLALAALCIYQWLLLGDLRTFIIDGPRLTLFSMNREGVLGLMGFVAIFYIAEDLGRQFSGHARKAKEESGRQLSSASWMPVVLSADIVLWACTWLSKAFIQPTSRQVQLQSNRRDSF